MTVAFLFAPKHHVIVLQRSSTGARISALMHLLEHLTEIPSIAFSIIIEKEPLARLLRMQHISKLSYNIDVAKSTVAEDYRGMSVSQCVQLAKNHDALTVKMEIGMGRSRESLALSRVIETIKDLLKIRKEEVAVEVKSVVVNGKTAEDEKIAALDLLKERLVAVVEVKTVNRELQPATLENAVMMAYKEKEEELSRYIGI